MKSHPRPEPQDNSDRAIMASSLWLHIGYIGVTALAGGLIMLFDGEAKWLSALALAFSGAALAVVSWHRSLIVLERAERALSVVPDKPGESASRAVSGQTRIRTIAKLSLARPRSNRRA